MVSLIPRLMERRSRFRAHLRCRQREGSCTGDARVLRCRALSLGADANQRDPSERAADGTVEAFVVGPHLVDAHVCVAAEQMVRVA